MHRPLVAITTDFLEAFSKIPKVKQKKVKEFAEKFMEGPDSPGINYEKINAVRDEKIRTVRVDIEYVNAILKVIHNQ